MRGGIGVYEAGLFKYAQSVTPAELCFTSEVYRIAQTGARFDWDEMTGLFNSFRPVVASVPGVHGNSTFVNYVEHEHREHARDEVESIRISPAEEQCTSPPALGAYLAGVLQCRRAGGSLARLLESSRRLEAIRTGGRTALVMLNACRCGTPEASEWLSVCSVDLDANHRDLLQHHHIRFVLVGNYDLLLHGVAAPAADWLCTVAIEPYTQHQVNDLLAVPTDPDDNARSFRFDPEALDAIYQNTHGDKYFTNLLAVLAITAARGNTAPADFVQVGRVAVDLSAGLVAKGLMAEDRVTGPFRQAFREEHAVAAAVVNLAGAGPEAWPKIDKDVRRRLFQLGIVGPPHAPPEAARPHVASPPRDLFAIRNPLMRTFAGALIYEDATRGAESTSQQAAVRYADPSRGGAETVPGLFDSFQVGETCYRLRRPISGTFSPQTLTFQVADADFLTGRGETLERARADWQVQFHVWFQTLFVKIASELTPADKDALDQLNEFIDLEEYRKMAIQTVREIGTVERARPFPVVIRWEDCTEDTATADALPAEFITYAKGQRFEAVVAREPLGYRLVRIVHSQRLAPLPAMTPKEVGELWDSLPTTRSLPEADWE
jgi:hypothetical protein